VQQQKSTKDQMPLPGSSSPDYTLVIGEDTQAILALTNKSDSNTNIARPLEHCKRHLQNGGKNPVAKTRDTTYMLDRPHDPLEDPTK
jgi:hypothetical protein